MTANQPAIIRQSSIKAIKDVLSGGYPVVAIETWEEESSLTTLSGFFNSAFKGNGSFMVWDLQNGLCEPSTGSSEPLSAIEALEKIQESEKPGFYIFKDLSEILSDNEIQRRIKNVYSAFRGRNKFLILFLVLLYLL